MLKFFGRKIKSGDEKLITKLFWSWPKRDEGKMGLIWGWGGWGEGHIFFNVIYFEKAPPRFPKILIACWIGWIYAVHIKNLSDLKSLRVNI